MPRLFALQVVILQKQSIGEVNLPLLKQQNYWNQKIHLFFSVKCSKKSINTFIRLKLKVEKELEKSGLNYTISSVRAFFKD